MDFQVRSCAWCFFVEEFSNFQTNLFIILHKLSLFFRCHKSTAYHLGLYKDSYPSKANSCITYVLVFRDWQNIFLQLCPWYQRSYLKYVNIFNFSNVIVCDQIGRFLILGHKFPYKSTPNALLLLTFTKNKPFEQKNFCKYFLGYFLKILGNFWFQHL